MLTGLPIFLEAVKILLNIEQAGFEVSGQKLISVKKLNNSYDISDLV